MNQKQEKDEIPTLHVAKMYQNLSFGNMQEDQKTRNGQKPTLIFLHVSEND